MAKSPVILLILIQVIWAVSYVFSKFLLNTIPPMLWVCIKNGLAAGILVAIAFWMKRPHPKLSKEFWIPLLVFAFLGNVFTQSFFLVGLAHTTAINSAILSSITPMVTLIGVISLGLEKPSFPQIIGLIISLIGILIFLRIDQFGWLQSTLLGDGFIVLSSICYGLYFALSKKFLVRFDSLWIAAWFCIITAISTSYYLYAESSDLLLTEMSFWSWIAAAYNVLFATVLGYFLVILAISYQSAVKIAHYEYLQPIIATFLSYLFLNETLSASGFVGAFLILLGLGFSFERIKT